MVCEDRKGTSDPHMVHLRIDLLLGRENVVADNWGPVHWPRCCWHAADTQRLPQIPLRRPVARERMVLSCKPGGRGRQQEWDVETLVVRLGMWAHSLLAFRATCGIWVSPAQDRGGGCSLRTIRESGPSPGSAGTGFPLQRGGWVWRPTSGPGTIVEPSRLPAEDGAP